MSLIILVFMQLQPRANKLFTEDPTYPAASPWASSLIAEITKAENLLARSDGDADGDGLDTVDGISGFAVADDPYDGNLYAFTKSRNAPSRVSSGRAAPEVETGLVRICAISANQVDFGFMRKEILPKVQAIKSEHPPIIRTNRAELGAVGSPKLAFRESVLNTSATVGAVLVAWGAGGVLGGTGASELAASAGVSGGLAALTYLGIKTFADVAASWWVRPTKRSVSFDEEGAGVFGLAGGKLARVAGKPAPEELSDAALDPVEQFFSRGPGRRGSLADSEQKTSLQRAKQAI